MKPISSIVPVAALLSVLLAGCGQSEPVATNSPAPAAAKASSTTQPQEGRAITVTGDDTMKFDQTEIRAKAGEPLAVTLKNTGTMPKFSMGHNWVLLDQSVNVDAFAADAAQAAKHDYVPPAYEDGIIAATKLLGPKESDTVVFNAPSQPGRYVYLCSFPGHYQVGMKGVLIVE